MFCQLFSLQNKSFLCLQYVENKGFQTVIKHRLKAIQKHIKNELGNREKNTKNAHFVLKKCTFRFRDYKRGLCALLFCIRVSSLVASNPSFNYVRKDMLNLSKKHKMHYKVFLIVVAFPQNQHFHTLYNILFASILHTCLYRTAVRICHVMVFAVGRQYGA